MNATHLVFFFLAGASTAGATASAATIRVLAYESERVVRYETERPERYETERTTRIQE